VTACCWSARVSSSVWREGFAGARSLASFLYGVPTSDVATFAATTIILIAAALMACVIPAGRAMRVNPITALRYE
jgi:putative ABC transport system permease protein